jgi:hypothetical protein
MTIPGLKLEDLQEEVDLMFSKFLQPIPAVNSKDFFRFKLSQNPLRAA